MCGYGKVGAVVYSRKNLTTDGMAATKDFLDGINRINRISALRADGSAAWPKAHIL